MKKLFFMAILLLGIAGYSQYSTPRQLRTITMKDAYKGPMVRMHKMGTKAANTTIYMPMDTSPVYYSESDQYYTSDKGKIYIWSVSKNGTMYKKYLE